MKKRFREYDKVYKNFKQFFDQGDLGALLDRKADVELLRRINHAKAEKSELLEYETIMDNFNQKIRHISVFISELSAIMLPEKEHGKFGSESDLKKSI